MSLIFPLFFIVGFFVLIGTYRLVAKLICSISSNKKYHKANRNRDDSNHTKDSNTKDLFEIKDDVITDPNYFYRLDNINNKTEMNIIDRYKREMWD